MGSTKKTDVQSALDGIPPALPALVAAHEIGQRAARQGFDWPDVQGLFDKVEEEIHELRLELSDAKRPPAARRVEEEVGDLLFAVCNLARYVGSDPERCLRQANQKFTRRFKALEARAAGRGKTVSTMGAGELEALWNEIKRDEVE